MRLDLCLEKKINYSMLTKFILSFFSFLLYTISSGLGQFLSYGVGGEITMS